MHYSVEWKENRSILEMSFSLLDGKPKETVNIFFCSPDHFYQWNNRKLSESPPIRPSPPNVCLLEADSETGKERSGNVSFPVEFWNKGS